VNHTASQEGERLNLHQLHTANIIISHIAIKALIEAHPDGARVKELYEQFLGQMLATPSALGSPSMGAYLRDASERIYKTDLRKLCKTPPKVWQT
jgi:hypothetical protein